MLAARAAAEIRTDNQESRSLVARSIQNEIRVGMTSGEAQEVEDAHGETFSIYPLQEGLGHDHVSIDIGCQESSRPAGDGDERLYRSIFLTQTADIGDIAGDGRRSDHGRAHQMGARTGALTPFKISIGG